jgi:hypothetical protein
MLPRPSFSLFLIVFVVFCSCGKPVPKLQGIDKAAWVADRGACQEARTLMIGAVKANTAQLLALSEVDIVDLLGRPDEEELYKRNQKFYYYYLQPAPSCSKAVNNNALRLVIRFNAVGLAKEVTVE